MEKRKRRAPGGIDRRDPIAIGLSLHDGFVHVVGDVDVHVRQVFPGTFSLAALEYESGFVRSGIIPRESDGTGRQFGEDEIRGGAVRALLLLRVPFGRWFREGILGLAGCCLRVARLISLITSVAPMSGLLSAQNQTPGTNPTSQPLTYFSLTTCATFADLKH